MSKNTHSTKYRGYDRKRYYLRNVGPFSLTELIERAITVQTQDGNTYVNLYTGNFVLQTNPDRIASATQVYEWAVEVFNVEGKTIAVAEHRRRKMTGSFPNRLRRVVLEPKAGKGIA